MLWPNNNVAYYTAQLTEKNSCASSCRPTHNNLPTLLGKESHLTRGFHHQWNTDLNTSPATTGLVCCKKCAPTGTLKSTNICNTGDFGLCHMTHQISPKSRQLHLFHPTQLHSFVLTENYPSFITNARAIILFFSGAIQPNSGSLPPFVRLCYHTHKTHHTW